MRKKQSNRKSSVGFLFWIALILLVLVIFLSSRKRIDAVITATGFMNLFKNDDSPAVTAIADEKPDTSVADKILSVLKDDKDDGKDDSSSVPANPEEEQNITDTETIALQDTETPEIPDKTPEPDTEETKTYTKKRNTKLYYAKTNNAGEISLHCLIKSVPFNDSPLTESMKTLLTGLSSDELNNGYLSLIPEGTELLSASVKNGVAFLNFNESFRFNSLGREGMITQLQQIVYSATEFSTIDRVQFMISGSKSDYLGSEGLYIGTPLSRDSFK